MAATIPNSFIAHASELWQLVDEILALDDSAEALPKTPANENFVHVLIANVFPAFIRFSEKQEESSPFS